LPAYLSSTGHHLLCGLSLETSRDSSKGKRRRKRRRRRIEEKGICVCYRLDFGSSAFTLLRRLILPWKRFAIMDAQDTAVLARVATLAREEQAEALAPSPHSSKFHEHQGRPASNSSKSSLPEDLDKEKNFHERTQELDGDRSRSSQDSGGTAILDVGLDEGEGATPPVVASDMIQDPEAQKEKPSDETPTGGRLGLMVAALCLSISLVALDSTIVCESPKKIYQRPILIL
jgi:hypothetical protein